MEICVIENGATVKLKANLELKQIEAEKQSQKEARLKTIIEPLAFEIFKKCAEKVKNRSCGSFTFYLEFYNSDISPVYPAGEFPLCFEDKVKDIEDAFSIVKELLKKANYKASLHIYSRGWYDRSGKIYNISFEALD